MDKLFYDKYKCYEEFPISKLKHIPEISWYNNNYYIGVKRETNSDLIFEVCDKFMNLNEYYHVHGEVVTYIGYSLFDDEYITLQQEKLT